MEPELSTATDINVLGEYNLAGEFWQVKPLLDKLGIRLHACITGDARYRDIASSHRSRVNMMVCSAALINLARKMEERYGIPYFEGSFYGITDTSEALRTLAKMLVARGAPEDLIARTEALISEEEAIVWAKLAPYRERLKGVRVLLYTGGVKTWSIVSALQEIGIDIVDTSVRKATDEDKARIVELMGDDPHMVDAMSPRDMFNFLNERKADIMLSGGPHAIHCAEGPHALARHQSGTSRALRRLRRCRRTREGARPRGQQSRLGEGAQARAVGRGRQGRVLRRN